MNFGMQAGDFLLSTNILLSGNNYAKVALLFNFMNMGMVSKNTFHSIQGSYCVDTIKEFWEERRTEAISRLRGKDVMVLGSWLQSIEGDRHGIVIVYEQITIITYFFLFQRTAEMTHRAMVHSTAATSPWRTKPKRSFMLPL